MDCNKLNAIYMPIDEIIPDPKNERIHDDDNIEFLKKGVKKFRQQKPILISKDKIIIAGHGIYQACKKAGWRNINVVVSDLTKSDIDAFRIYDNKSAEKSIWDQLKLGETLAELNSVGHDLSEYGFDFGEPELFYDSNDEDFEFKDPGDERKALSDKPITLIVTFDSHENQQDLFQELTKRGFKVKV